MRRELERREADLAPTRGHARRDLRTPISQSGDRVSVPGRTPQVHARNRANLRKGSRKEAQRGGALTAVSESRQRIGNNASRSGTSPRNGSRIRSAGQRHLADVRGFPLRSLPAARNARERRARAGFRALAAARRCLRAQPPSDKLIFRKCFKNRGVMALFAPLQTCIRGSDSGANLRREGRWDAERWAAIARGQGVRSGSTCPRTALRLAGFRHARVSGMCTRAAVAHNFHVTPRMVQPVHQIRSPAMPPGKRGTAR